MEGCAQGDTGAKPLIWVTQRAHAGGRECQHMAVLALGWGRREGWLCRAWYVAALRLYLLHYGQQQYGSLIAEGKHARDTRTRGPRRARLSISRRES